MQHSIILYCWQCRLSTIHSEPIVASPHNNVSTPLHKCPACYYQQYSHSSRTNCCLSTQQYFTTTPHLSCLLLSTVKPKYLNTHLPLPTTIFHNHSTTVLFAAINSKAAVPVTLLPLHTTIFHNHSTPVLFAAVKSTATVLEHNVASLHNKVSPPLHTCSLCCYQQYSHSC